jgi:hypothetical protein
LVESAGAEIIDLRVAGMIVVSTGDGAVDTGLGRDKKLFNAPRTFGSMTMFALLA